MSEAHDISSPGRSPSGLVEQGIEKLKSAGMRLTPQRKVILELFADEPEHWTPQQIFGKLDGSGPSLSLATVYNTLELLEEVGLVKRVNGHDGQTYFDPTIQPHHHAVCEECGELFDVQVESESLQLLVNGSTTLHEADREFAVREASLWLRGVCSSCS